MTDRKRKEIHMIKEAIQELVEHRDLTYECAMEVMDEIMSGKASQLYIGAYLTALRMKGETIGEITASAAAMRQHCTRLLHDMEVLEIVGTGGDGANTFKISTTSSIVVASGGISVAKHGNRGVSSKSGAADVLEALGVRIDLEPEKSAEILKQINLCFMFAQKYHTAMRFVAPVRKELGIRTIFNILGPLANPAGANLQLLGVYEESLVEPLAEVLLNLGVRRAMVVYGEDRMDEISLSAPTKVCEIRDGKKKCYKIQPEDFGLARCAKEDLLGGGPEENARITLEILNGAKGAKRDAVLLNAGACFYLVKDGITMEEGIQMAAKLIDSGKAKEKLQQLIELSNR